MIYLQFNIGIYMEYTTGMIWECVPREGRTESYLRKTWPSDDWLMVNWCGDILLVSNHALIAEFRYIGEL